MRGFKRWRGTGLRRDLRAAGARQDRGVALALGRGLDAAQPGILVGDLVRIKPRERRVVAGQFQKFGNQSAMRRDQGSTDGGRLLRSAGEHHAGKV